MSRTVITFLLDRSGSMQSCKDATIEAFNAYLNTLQEGEDDVDFTFLQFDSSSLDKICVAQPAKSVSGLTSATYQPRASTPLIDSAYKTIKAVEEALAKRDDKPKVVICIQTDGYENASTEHTQEELNALVKEKTALGWQFNFMGAGIDAYAQATRLGILADSALSYDHTNRHATKAAFAASANNARQFGHGLRASASYSSEQRLASGDRFAASHGLGSVPAAMPAAPRPVAKPATKPKIVDDFSL